MRAARQRGLLGTAVAGHVDARFREEPTIPKRETQATWAQSLPLDGDPASR
jgi:hypothetical protein